MSFFLGNQFDFLIVIIIITFVFCSYISLPVSPKFLDKPKSDILQHLVWSSRMFLAAKSRWMIWKKEEENFIHFLGFDLRDVFGGILVLDKTQRHIELFKIKAQIIRVHGLKFRGDKFSKLQGVGSLNVEFYCIFIEESLKLAKFPQFDPLPLSRGEGVCDQTLRVHGGPCPPGHVWPKFHLPKPFELWKPINWVRPNIIVCPILCLKRIVEWNLKIINPIIHNIVWTYTTYARRHF